MSGFREKTKKRTTTAMTTSQEKYYQYLDSDYWKEVSYQVKKRAGFKCQVCNSQLDLVAHHRTYEHRGAELNHLDDIVCLCQRCHALFHGKNERKAKNPPQEQQPQKKWNRKVVVQPDDPDVLANMPSGDGDIVLTRDLVQRLMTFGAFSSKAAAPLGVRINQQRKGWVRGLEGTTVTRETYRKCLMGRFSYERGKLP